MSGGRWELLILNWVELAEDWDGRGVGAYLAGDALLAMDGDAHCIATVLRPAVLRLAAPVTARFDPDPGSGRQLLGAQLAARTTELAPPSGSPSSGDPSPRAANISRGSSTFTPSETM